MYQDGAGHLVIKPIRASDGTWTSARVETQRTDFAAPAGGQLEMVASLEQPNPASGLGYWPAFWALGDAARANGATSWPSTGEIDIMEDVNARSQVAQTLHCGTGSGGPCNETIGLGSGLQDCAGCQTGYHTYAAVIDRRNTAAEELRFYVDGALTSTVTQAQVGTAAWQQAIDRGYFMILNVAMGGAFPDALCGCSTAASLGSTTSGAGMSVDYVAVYQQGGGSTPTPPPTSPTTPPTTPAPGVPAAPTDLHVTGTTSTSVSMAWTASAGATSYQVLRAGIPIATTTGTSFTDANLNPSTPYLYSVRAVNGAGTSGASNQISVTTPATGSTGGSTGTPTPTPTPTPTGDGSTGGASATSTIQAEAYSAQHGTATETTTDTGGGQDVGSIANGDWLRYDGVDFGSAPLRVLQARVASGAAGGVSGLVEVRLDSLTAPPVGTFALASTGGWQSWRTVPADVTGVTGTHTVYLTFSSGQPADYVNVNWFTFSAT